MFQNNLHRFTQHTKSSRAIQPKGCRILWGRNPNLSKSLCSWSIVSFSLGTRTSQSHHPWLWISWGARLHTPIELHSTFWLVLGRRTKCDFLVCQLDYIVAKIPPPSAHYVAHDATIVLTMVNMARARRQLPHHRAWLYYALLESWTWFFIVLQWSPQSAGGLTLS
jgi:hypothetical protein